jgi:hypothetical protein
MVKKSFAAGSSRWQAADEKQAHGEHIWWAQGGNVLPGLLIMQACFSKPVRSLI